MDELTEWELEQELEGHMQEQRASLVAIDEALRFDATNQELVQVKEELMTAIKAAEESLFQLKRSRLLQEVDAMSQGQQLALLSASVDTKGSRSDERTDLVDEETVLEQDLSFKDGSKCRFRHTNGRWYNGKVISSEALGPRVFFLSPTTESMQICRFYLQQRCRFGGNCRQSHGMEIPVHTLRPFNPPKWQQVCVGTTILACEGDGLGLWKPAELESWDEVHQKALIVFIDNGRKAEVCCNLLALSEFAEVSDSSEMSSEDEDEDVEEEAGTAEIEEVDSVGFFSPGTQTDTVVFAKWEKHTRGVASKLMASMGYREGMGLGKSGQGQLAPIEARVLPPKQSLDFINKKKQVRDSDRAESSMEPGKQKARGGRRKSCKKWAAAAFAAKLEQDRAPDVFGFINQQLRAVQQDTRIQPESFETSKDLDSNGRHGSGEKKVRKEDRRSIVAHEDEMMEIRGKISKLEEMALRNRKEKAVYDGINRRLEEARNAFMKAEAAHASASNAVQSKEKEKKWLRF